MRLATSVIILVLGAQSLALAARWGRVGWPFTDYPMYSRIRQEGDRLSAGYFIYAKTKDGQEIEISPENIDLNPWLFLKWGQRLMDERYLQRADGTPFFWSAFDLRDRAPVLRLIDQKKSASPAAPDSSKSFKAWLKSTSLTQLLQNEEPDLHSIFLARAEQKLAIDIVQLRVEDTPYVLTRHGLASTPPTVILVHVGSD
jgi:hypothetical protein